MPQRSADPVNRELSTLLRIGTSNTQRVRTTSAGRSKRFVKNQAMAIILGLVGSQLFACTDLAERVRQHTYPPGFHYISNEQLRSTMWRLAYHSRELRELLKSPEDAVSHRAELLNALGMMEEAVVDLNRSGWPTNHPLVDANRSSFLRDIRMAREGLSREPPNFLLLGSVSGACSYCHGNR